MMVRLAAVLVCLSLFAPALSHATAINHTYVEVNTDQTTSSTSFVTVPGATVASGNFTVGKKYLIVVSAHSTVNADSMFINLIHGSTEFNGSNENINTGSGTLARTSYFYVTVWTAVSSEAVTLQHRTRLGTSTAHTNFASIFVMNLSDDLIENTDWYFNENTADTTVNASANVYTGAATLTFTPATANDTWLVIGTTLVNFGGQVTYYMSARMNSGGSTNPTGQLDAWNTTFADTLFGFSRTFTLAASSQTFTMEFAASGASGSAQHLNSTVFALNLSKFKNVATAYTDGTAALSASAYAPNLQTASITPSVAGDVWVGGTWTFDLKSSGRLAKQRIQVDSSDAPAGQTTAAYTFKQTNDELANPESIQTMVTGMTAAAHTVNLDASVDATTTTPDGAYRNLWAITMELASGILQSSGSGSFVGVLQ